MSVAMKKFTGACQVKVLCPDQVFTCMMIMIRQICPLGCFKKHLFLRFQLAFFILCTNVLKSYHKKFGVIWRSFDPPTRGSYFVWELPLKYKGNSNKIENLLYFLSFLSNSFLFSCFVMATML